ncbi:MAG: hypothetical protein IKK83_00400 [Clostridia bacterium]|nr:hypothetical protein [Clostridia bacterium]
MKKLITAILTAAMLLCTPVFAADNTSVAPPNTADVVFVKAVADVTGDGKVTSLDAAIILRYDAGLVKSFAGRDETDSADSNGDDVIPLGDVNADGRITSLDAAFVLRYDAGYIKSPDDVSAPDGSSEENDSSDVTSSEEIADSEETPDPENSSEADVLPEKSYSVKHLGYGTTAIETEGSSEDYLANASVLISSVEELAAYIEGSDMGEGKESFAEATALYDEAYFEQGVLVVSSFAEPTMRTEMDMEDVYLKDGELCVVLNTYRPMAYDEECVYWHLVTEYTAPVESASFVRHREMYFFPEGGLLEGAQPIHLKSAAPSTETHIIKSREELSTYLSGYKVYDDGGKGSNGKDRGLHRACTAYDTAFFEENYLVIISAIRGSGSDTPFIIDAELTEEGDIRVETVWVYPSLGTADMADWRLLVPINKEGVAEDAEVIKESKAINLTDRPWDAEYTKKYYSRYTIIHFDGADGYQYCLGNEKLFNTLSALDYSGEGTGASQYKIEFSGGVYDVNLTEGYVFCDKGRASLTEEQLAELRETIELAEYCAVAFGIKY